ncbi:hypothetical protein HZS_7572 [Henneguya salminicola]|nr:hypothetical protein HZS_7572 [Henneguya salminicola]
MLLCNDARFFVYEKYENVTVQFFMLICPIDIFSFFSNFKIISSEQNKPMLLLNGYSHLVDKVNSKKSTTSERCILKERKSRMKTNNIFDEVLSAPKDIAYIIGELRSIAISLSLAPQHIISETIR